MKDNQEISSEETMTLGLLAAALIIQLTKGNTDTGPVRKGTLFSHNFDSSFEVATSALERLGVIASTGSEQLSTDQFQLTMNVEEIPQFLEESEFCTAGTFSETLSAFVNIACYFGGVSSERSPFSPPENYERSLSALAELGYLKKTADQYCWKDKISTAMTACYLWDDGLASYDTQHKDSVCSEALLAWNTMPLTMRRAHFSEEVIDRLSLARTLSRSWKDGKWTEVTQNEYMYISKRLFDLADELVKLSKGQ